MRKDRIRLVEGGQERVGEPLFGLRRAGQLAEESFTAIDAGEDVLERIRDLYEVVDQILAGGDELIDVGLPGSGDDRSGLQRFEAGTARRDVDVAVACKQAELLQARSRIATDAVGVLAVHHQLDVDILLPRIAREINVADHSHRHSRNLHRVSLGQSGDRVELHLVFILAGEDLLLGADEEEKHH